MINNRETLVNKKHYDFGDLVSIMGILRGENGCPWDLEQSHKSIRKNLIEETYEVIEAIDNNDYNLMCEELGDLMLQVVFHSRIAKDSGGFDINDVISGICKKLINRHPHIFGDVVAKSSDKVLNNWDKIKMAEKGQESRTDVLKSVSKSLPSLMRSQKVQHKAAKAGFDWDDASGAIEKLKEETEEVIVALSKGNAEEVKEEVGDLLFAAVNVSRKAGVDAEESLYNACDKFIGRFSKVEKVLDEDGLEMDRLSLDELDRYWEKIKKQ